MNMTLVDSLRGRGSEGGEARPVPPIGRAAIRRLAALGGGTGLPIVLRGMKEVLFPPGRSAPATRDPGRLTAIVSVADDGGSSGRLRRAYGVPPPGDIRNCLVALAEGDPALAAVFDFRFDGDGGIGGHSLGNLILTALDRMEVDFSRAVDRAGRLLAIRGRVLPATLKDVALRAEFADGSRVVGESRLQATGRPVRRVSLLPSGARALPEAIRAIERADLITIGPGSLYTSLIPVLLVQGLAAAIARSPARVVLIMNLMTEPGETDGYTAFDTLLAIRRHLPRLRIHDVLLNNAPIGAGRAARYTAQGAIPIASDAGSLRSLGCRPVRRDLLAAGERLRHDPVKLAGALLELAAGATP